jgi:hypothetical protein
MIIFKRIFLAFALFQLFISCAIADDSINKKDDTSAVNNKTLNGKCSDAIDKKTLKDGWYLWEPYQFNKLTASGYNLVNIYLKKFPRPPDDNHHSSVSYYKILINREEVGIFLTPSYMYYIMIIVLIGFSMVRLLEYYNERANGDEVINNFLDTVLVLGDALGQAAFIFTGVSIAIMAKIKPIEFWGPFFAFLTASGGGILRDLIRKKHEIVCLTGRNY